MASRSSTVISKGTFVRGRVSGSGDLEIAGHVEGDVACSGEVTVDTGGLIASNITGTRIVVRGAVKGDLTADEAIVIESGARVVGDLRAPRISIASGGLVRGHVQTGGAGAPRPARAHAAAEKSRPAATPARAKAAPPPPPVAKKASTNHSKAPRGATLAGARIPPAPVVPVLKKKTKAVQKKQR